MALSRPCGPRTRHPGSLVRPYDAFDTFGEFMGVRADTIGESIAADMTKLAAPLAPAGTVAASAPNGYVLENELNDASAPSTCCSRRALPCGACRAPTGLSRATSSWLGSERGCCRGGKANRRGLHGARGCSAGFGIRDSQAEDRDVSALRRRQHGRRLDAPDVRAIQCAVQVPDGRRIEEGRPQRELRRHRLAL